MKNLVEVETRIEKQAAGATTQAEVKGKIIDFVWWMKKQGYKPTTITTYSRNINTLITLGANVLYDPESVKETLAKHQVDVNTKYVIAASYTTFLRFLGKTWVKPRYRPEAKTVFIPTDKEIQLAINSGYRESIAFVQLLYETGCRSKEAERIEWTDLDVERRKISVKASKNGKPRIITVSKELIGKLLSLPRNCSTIFPAKAPNTRRQAFYRRMKRLARVHNNPRFLKIHHHTFRHCRALREYHKTRSPLHVKKILGHRSLLTTQRYIELYTEIYGDLKPDQYVCETASTVKEAKQLIEAGYEYVNDMDGVQLYRKVKVA